MTAPAQQRGFIILLFAACALFAPAQDVSAREAKVLIGLFEVNSNEDVSHIQSGIAALLPSRVAVPKKIIVIDTDAQRSLQPQTGKSAPLSEKLLRAKKLGADYLVTGSITKLGSTISIDTGIADLQRGGDPVPVFIQCNGLDSLIPEVAKLGQAIRQTIEQNPVFDSYEPPALPSAARSGTMKAPTVSATEKPDRAKNIAGSREQPEELETPAQREPAANPSEPRYFRDPAPPGTRNQPGALFASLPVLAEYIRAVPLNCLAAGDVDGDGRKELLAAGGDEIHIMRFDGKKLVPLEEIKTGTGGRIVHIDTANLNGKAPDEIYVSSFEARSANSCVLELNNNAYTSIQNGQPWFFRAITLPDDRALLLGQDARLNSPFGGDIYSLSWDNGTLAAGEKYNLPGGLNVYGFTAAHMLGGDMKYLAFTTSLFSPEYRLSIMNDKGKAAWRDTQSLGGTGNFFKKYMFADQTEVREPVPLRIICRAGQPGSNPFIIVARNVKKGQKILKQLMNYNQGELLCLVWNGAGFDNNWRSGYANGFISDYIYEDINNDGIQELCMLSVAGEALAERAVNKITIYKQAAY